MRVHHILLPLTALLTVWTVATLMFWQMELGRQGGRLENMIRRDAATDVKANATRGFSAIAEGAILSVRNLVVFPWIAAVLFWIVAYFQGTSDASRHRADNR